MSLPVVLASPVYVQRQDELFFLANRTLSFYATGNAVELLCWLEKFAGLELNLYRTLSGRPIRCVFPD